MSIEKMHRIGPSEYAFEQLKKLILKGECQPGERLPSENDLAASFGVSRISVRQAIQRLATMGLIETRWGEGNFVREPDAGTYVNDLLPMIYLNKDSAEHIWEFRMAIEVEGAYLAAKRITDDELDFLRGKMQEMIEKENDVEKYIAADLEFHCGVLEATENPIFIHIAAILKDVLEDSITMFTRALGKSEGIYHHQRILAALEKRDPELTRQMMHDHISSAYELSLEYLKKEEAARQAGNEAG